MIIANFTPDKIHWTHEGIGGVLKPGDVTEFPDNRAKHILTKFDTRGVLQLRYGDNEEERRAQAMETWRRFWEHQVIVFNQHNEGMKNANKPYIRAPKHIEDHAKLLGIGLVGPWMIQRETPDLERMRAENATMKEEVSNLKNMIEKFILSQGAAAIAQPAPAPVTAASVPGDGDAPAPDPDALIIKAPAPIEVEWDTVINTFMFKSKKQLEPWVDDNLGVITTWPTWLLDKLNEKYVGFYDRSIPVEGYSEI